MDAGIGKILSALDDMAALSNSIVVFTCDHGGSEDIVRHRPLSEGFGRLGEGGIRVPLIISWPGMLPAGTTSAQESILMDLAATLMRAASVQPPQPLDGIDLVPILRGSQSPTERVLCWRAPYDTSAKAIRN
jgi:arylsulfatase A